MVTGLPCLQGGVVPVDHPAVPLTPEALARDAQDCAAMGAMAFHVHASAS